MIESFSPTRRQVEACRRGEHVWLTIGSTTFRGREATSLTCAHCTENGYSIKESTT